MPRVSGSTVIMFSGSSQTVKLPIAQEKMSRDSLETEEDIGALCTEVGNGMKEQHEPCLLYTSDAADDSIRV